MANQSIRKKELTKIAKDF